MVVPKKGKKKSGGNAKKPGPKTTAKSYQETVTTRSTGPTEMTRTTRSAPSRPSKPILPHGLIKLLVGEFELTICSIQPNPDPPKANADLDVAVVASPVDATVTVELFHDGALIATENAPGDDAGT